MQDDNNYESLLTPEQAVEVDKMVADARKDMIRFTSDALTTLWKEQR